MARVNEFIAQIDWERLPEVVQQSIKRCLLDTLGVAIAAKSTDLASIAANFALNQYGATAQSSSGLMGFEGKCSVPGAALAGGLLIDALDAHDGHRLTKGHAGASVVPALIAMVSGLQHLQQTVSGKSFLEALVIGYEVALRSGIQLHSSSKEYSTSGAWTALGVAAMGSKLHKLNTELTNHAMGIAEYYGPRSPMMRCIDHPTMLKDGAGWGALAGVSAVFLAQQGFTGAPALTITEIDEQDYFKRYELLEQYFKPWPVCRWAQPAVEAVEQLNQNYTIDIEQIEAIHIETFHEAVRLGNKRPKTTEEAQYSIGYPVAAMLAKGKLGLEEVSADALFDTKINTLQSMIKMTENVEFNQLFPQQRIATVSICMKDGNNFVAEKVEARGDADNPLSNTEIEQKFYQLTSSSMSSSMQKELLDLVFSLHQENDMKAMLDLVLGKQY